MSSGKLAHVRFADRFDNEASFSEFEYRVTETDARILARSDAKRVPFQLVKRPEHAALETFPAVVVMLRHEHPRMQSAQLVRREGGEVQSDGASAKPAPHGGHFQRLAYYPKSSARH